MLGSQASSWRGGWWGTSCDKRTDTSPWCLLRLHSVPWTGAPNTVGIPGSFSFFLICVHDHLLNKRAQVFTATSNGLVGAVCPMPPSSQRKRWGFLAASQEFCFCWLKPLLRDAWYSINSPYLSPVILAFFLFANVRMIHSWIHKRKGNPYKNLRGWRVQMPHSSDYNFSGTPAMWGFGDKSQLKLTSPQRESYNESIFSHTCVTNSSHIWWLWLVLIKTITVLKQTNCLWG